METFSFHPGAIHHGARIVQDGRVIHIDDYVFTGDQNLLVRAREIDLEGKPIGDAPDDCEIINLGKPESLIGVR